MLSFNNQIILITGASRGVGAASAIKFAEAGASGVIINYRNNRAAALAVAKSVEAAGTNALVAQADVSRGDETAALVKLAVESFGRLDVVVANAGVWPAEDRAITDLSEEQWNETMQINVNGVYYVCREAARIFSKQGSGNIVIVSSTAGQRGEAFHADYASSKGAVISLTKSLATELGGFGIRVNCVAPGWIDTDMAASALQTSDEKLTQIKAAIPLGRIATADDVANPILFLASDLARHITGEVLNINGGSVLCG